MKPLNNHVMIRPMEYDGFMASQKGQYEEIGEVLDVAVGVDLAIGTYVYFDAWLAKKYPVKGEVGKFVWFVDYKDIVAYESLPE